MSSSLPGTWRSEGLPPHTVFLGLSFVVCKVGLRVMQAHTALVRDFNIRVVCGALHAWLAPKRSKMAVLAVTVRPGICGPGHTRACWPWGIGSARRGQEHGAGPGWAGPGALGGVSSRCQLEPTYILTYHGGLQRGVGLALTALLPARHRGPAPQTLLSATCPRVPGHHPLLSGSGFGAHWGMV